jgi:4-hydroxy-tetrahydrodipicolinate synthase
MTFKPKGIIPAMVTPLDDNGNVNKLTLGKLTNYLINEKVHGLFVVGSTGEWYGLDIDQKKKVFETVVKEANGRVPIYAGTGAITTQETVKLTKIAKDIGVSAVSILTPVFISPNQEELYNHYRIIANSVDIPILLYNNPGRTGINLSADLVERLSKIDNIIGIKDSSGDMTLTGEFIRRTNDNFCVLAGRDTLILSTLIYGGKGAISATANIVPKIAVKIYEEYIKGNIKEALKAQYDLAPLRLAFSLGSFPVVIKEGLKLIGIDAGFTLKPIEPMTEDNKIKLKKVLEEMGVFKKGYC